MKIKKLKLDNYETNKDFIRNMSPSYCAIGWIKSIVTLNPYNTEIGLLYYNYLHYNRLINLF